MIFHFYLLITNLSLKSFRLQNKVQKERWKPESGIQPLLGRGIRNPRTWNPKSMDMESEIRGHGIRNPQRGIQNPKLSWITLHGLTLHNFDYFQAMNATILRCFLDVMISVDRFGIRTPQG